MILMEFLLAPTVPSEPRPQNLQLMVAPPAGAEVLAHVQGQVGHIVHDADGEVVLRLAGFMLSNTAFIWAGVVSLEPRP